jgi:hypothetical protein
MAWLQARGWSLRPDTGWCPFDFEVARPPWVLIRVVSALEVYPGGKRRFLLKLNAVPSLGAWLSAGFMVLVGVVLAGLVRAPGVVTAAMCLLVALLAWGGFRVQARRARSQLAVAVDEFARAHGLVRLPWIGQRRWFQGLLRLIRRRWSPNPTRTAVPADSPFAPPGRSADPAPADGPVEPNKSG